MGLQGLVDLYWSCLLDLFVFNWCGSPIEILDLECMLCHVTGVQNENKNALINPPSWIFPRSIVMIVCKMSWGEFNLPL